MAESHAAEESDVEKDAIECFRTQNQWTEEKSDTFITPEMDQTSDLNINTIVLIGAAGSGKSSFGNVFTMTKEPEQPSPMERYGSLGGFSSMMNKKKEPEKEESDSDKCVFESESDAEQFEVYDGEHSRSNSTQIIYGKEDDDGKRLRIIEAPSFD